MGDDYEMAHDLKSVGNVAVNVMKGSKGDIIVSLTVAKNDAELADTVRKSLLMELRGRKIGFTLQADENPLISDSYSIRLAFSPQAALNGDRLIDPTVTNVTSVIEKLSADLPDRDSLVTRQRAMRAMDKAAEIRTTRHAAQPVIEAALAYVKTQFPHLTAEQEKGLGNAIMDASREQGAAR